MAMLRGVPRFMGMGVVMVTGWARLMWDAVAGMLTEAMFTGPVMATGCCRLTGADVMFTVLVPKFIWAPMVTAALALTRLIWVVAGEDTVTGVAALEWHTSLVSGNKTDRDCRTSS